MADCRLFVFVFLPGQTDAVPAGTFDYDEQLQVGRFRYDARYAERAGALAVDPVNCAFGNSIVPADLNGGLYGAFRDAAPDYWGRLVRARGLWADLQRLNEADLLLQGGASRVGCLDFRAEPDAPGDRRPLPARTLLADLDKAADELKEGKPIDPALQEILQHGTGLGGARPKCTVEDGEGIWVAKFHERHDEFNNPRVEHATLTLAAKCGLTVAQSEMATLDDGRDVLLVRRFDRVRTDGAHTRIGFISALTMLQADEGDRASWSYPALAERMRRHPIGRDDLSELFRRMVFNAAVRNTDDHPRNHGFLYDQNRLALSPAYDLVPEPARPGVSEDFQLAMTIGEQGRQATLSNVLSRCPAFGLSREAAREICAAVARETLGWREHFRQEGITEADCRKFEGSFALAEAFSRNSPT